MKAVVDDAETASLDLICSGHLPPPFLDFILSRNLADGVVVAGCPGGDCQYRFGTEWTSAAHGAATRSALAQARRPGAAGLAWEDRWQGCRDLLTWWLRCGRHCPQPVRRRTVAPRRAPAVLRRALAAAAHGVFLRSSHGCPSGRAFNCSTRARMVSLSFSHAGQHPRMPQTDPGGRDQLPPNMRKPRTARASAPVRVLRRG
jgi:hypothetical protein